MYIYGFYNFDYDETTFVKLGHQKKFTKEEFENIVNKCRIETEDELKDNIDRLDTMDENEIISDEESQKLDSLCHEGQILNNIYDKLKKYYGFIKLEPIYTYTFNRGFYGKGQKVINKVEN